MTSPESDWIEPNDHDRLFDQALGGYRQARQETANGLAESGVLRELASREHVVGLVQQSIKFLASRLESLPSHAEKECDAGCSWCCHQRIDVTPLEALAIAGCLELTRDEEALAEIRELLAANAKRVSQMSKAEHARARVPCALLSEEGVCSIYPVRPVPCVGWHSTSRDRCRQNFESGDPGDDGIPLDMACLLESKGYWFGLSDALTRSGLDANRYELHSAVSRALETPDAARRWLAGEDIFSGCTAGQADADTVMQLAGDENQTIRLVWRVDSDGSGAFVIDR